MSQLDNVVYSESPVLPGVDVPANDREDGIAPDLRVLLTRYSELSRDMERVLFLLEQLTRRFASPAASHSAPAKRNVAAARPLPTKHLTIARCQRAAANRHSQRPSAAAISRPLRSKLERACLIALMETSESVSVETIYDRIERRGSFSFAGYKQPFRAILLAMGGMVRNGEVVLCNEGGRRCWRWQSAQSSQDRSTLLRSA
jgi:hypothetical protein